MSTHRARAAYDMNADSIANQRADSHPCGNPPIFHSYEDGVCQDCGVKCEHAQAFVDGSCPECDFECEHAETENDGGRIFCLDYCQQHLHTLDRYDDPNIP